MIASLINKTDSFELIRDRIAEILAAETANQQSLATQAGENPDLWKLRVFLEAANPFEAWLDPANQVDTTPIVNVWYDSGQFPRGAGDVARKQHCEGTFNIDIFGYGIAAGDGAGGYNPGDRTAKFEAQRAIRLIRNILMAGEYAYLSARGVVGTRWIDAVNMLQPTMDGRTIQHIAGARIQFGVRFIELAPQYEPVTLESIGVDITRLDDGELLAQAEFDYTNP